MPASPAGFDLAHTDRLLSTTRAVRRRLDLARPVPRETLLDCLRLSQQAPTGSNAQGWRWVVVTDATRRAALAALYRRSGEAYLSAARANLRDDAQTLRVYDSALWLLEHLAEVPVHVIPCLLGRLPADVPEAMRAGYYGSIFPAVWSFQLALRSRGLGSVLTTLHLLAEREAADLLGIPFEQATQVALLPVAFTKGADFQVAERRPVEEIVYWDGWRRAGG
jgi:nitroreductase